MEASITSDSTSQLANTDKEKVTTNSSTASGKPSFALNADSASKNDFSAPSQLSLQDSSLTAEVTSEEANVPDSTSTPGPQPLSGRGFRSWYRSKKATRSILAKRAIDSVDSPTKTSELQPVAKRDRREATATGVSSSSVAPLVKGDEMDSWSTGGEKRDVAAVKEEKEASIVKSAPAITTIATAETSTVRDIKSSTGSSAGTSVSPSSSRESEGSSSVSESSTDIESQMATAETVPAGSKPKKDGSRANPPASTPAKSGKSQTKTSAPEKDDMHDVSDAIETVEGGKAAMYRPEAASSSRGGTAQTRIRLSWRTGVGTGEAIGGLRGNNLIAQLRYKERD